MSDSENKSSSRSANQTLPSWDMIHIYKVEAHTVVVGNEFTDTLAKHAALHNYGHDDAFTWRQSVFPYLLARTREK